MQNVIIVIHLLVVLALIGVVLLQRSEGGLGLGGGGGGGVGGFLTGRGQSNAFTRATAILAAIFFVTSLTLGILASRGTAPKSLFEGGSPGSPASPPTGGGVLEDIEKMQQPQPAPQPPAGPQVPQSR